MAFDPETTGYDEKYYQGSFQLTEFFDGWWPRLFLVHESEYFERQGATLRITADGGMFLSEEIDAMAKSRMDISFIGILTVVAYQIISTEQQHLVWGLYLFH